MANEIVFMFMIVTGAAMAITIMVLAIVYSPKPRATDRCVRLERDNEDAMFASYTACELLNGFALTDKGGCIRKEIRYDRNVEIIWVTKEFYKEHWFLLKQAGFNKKEKSDGVSNTRNS